MLERMGAASLGAPDWLKAFLQFLSPPAGIGEVILLASGYGHRGDRSCPRFLLYVLFCLCQTFLALPIFSRPDRRFDTPDFSCEDSPPLLFTSGGSCRTSSIAWESPHERGPMSPQPCPFFCLAPACANDLAAFQVHEYPVYAHSFSLNF